jgi:hypothetical protein
MFAPMICSVAPQPQEHRIFDAQQKFVTRRCCVTMFCCMSVRTLTMKIYDYEHFIPGVTNNLYFADTRNSFLITSRYTRLARRQAKTDHYRKSSLL